MTLTFNAASRFRLAGRIVLCAALCAALWAALLPRLAAAQDKPAVPTSGGAQTFHPTLPYVLRIDGQVAPGGKVYVTERNESYLIVGAPLAGPVLIDVQTRKVSTLATAPVAHADGTLIVPAGAPRKAQGQFEVEGSSPVFTVEGKRVRLENPAPLLGLQDVAAIRAFNPEYNQRAAAYHPDAAALTQLAALKQPVRLRVYFATWCSVCTHSLPNLMKVLDGLKGAPLVVEYYGLPEDRNADPEPAKMNLKGIPTAIVYRQGQEVGRLTGAEWQQPEIALRTLLAPAR